MSRTRSTSSSPAAQSSRSGDDVRSVEPGDTIFVAAGVAHRFHDITDELQLIVVFAPPEGTQPVR